jgi:hypothetical protein
MKNCKEKVKTVISSEKNIVVIGQSIVNSRNILGTNYLLTRNLKWLRDLKLGFCRLTFTSWFSSTAIMYFNTCRIFNKSALNQKKINKDTRPTFVRDFYDSMGAFDQASSCL